MKLEVKDLSFSYFRNAPVLEDISFTADAGQLVSLVGPNGSGKSTLLRCINGLLKPKKPCVYLDGVDVHHIAPRERALLFGFAEQTVRVGMPLTVFDVVMLGRRPHQRWYAREEQTKAVWDALHTLGLAPLSQRLFSELSGGQQQMVMIASLLAQKPAVYLLDEPTNNLDIKNQLEIMSLVKSFTREQHALVVVVQHDLNHAYHYSDSIVMLKAGKLFSTGEPAKVFSRSNIRHVYEIEAKITTDVDGAMILPLALV